MLASLPEPAWALAALVAVFTTKHLIADFLLQTSWIAQGKDSRQDWIVPLCLHAAGHGVLTAAIAAATAPALWWLGLVDFGIHVALDRGKAVVGQAAELTLKDEKYWWLLGLDQYFHQLTNVAFAVVLASA